jgi:tight adherence protein C
MLEFALDHASLFITAIAVLIGLAAALVGWLLSRSAAEVPPEDRQYKDPPPLNLRLVWWPVQWISYYIGPLLRQRTIIKLQVKLRKAGLDYCINPSQFVAYRLVCAGLCAALFWWITSGLDPAQRGGDPLALSLYWQIAGVGLLLGSGYPVLWLRDRLAMRRSELLKTLPFFLDIITLCVEAGLNMQGAMTQAVAKGPQGVLREEIQRVLRDIRSGKARAVALRDMAERLNEPGITNFTTAVIQAESMGMNLGPVLRAQADQRRSERFLRAEKLAMEAPVKMLFPLIAFIFPCTFLVLFFPIVMKFIHSGL